MLYYNSVNPNSLRPYHTTLGPAEGPTCSKILAPPLVAVMVDYCSSTHLGNYFKQYQIQTNSIDKINLIYGKKHI